MKVTLNISIKLYARRVSIAVELSLGVYVQSHSTTLMPPILNISKRNLGIRTLKKKRFGFGDLVVREIRKDSGSGLLSKKVWFSFYCEKLQGSGARFRNMKLKKTQLIFGGSVPSAKKVRKILDINRTASNPYFTLISPPTSLLAKRVTKINRKVILLQEHLKNGKKIFSQFIKLLLAAVFDSQAAKNR